MDEKKKKKQEVETKNTAGKTVSFILIL